MASPATHRVTVTEARAITPRIRRLVFAGEGLAVALGTPSGAHAPYFKLVLGTEEKPAIRTYSIRRLDAERDEMHVDFVLHDDEGPGSAFGRAARPGMTAFLRGPGHLAVARCRHHRLAADHCGLPALSHLLENLAADAAGMALVEIPDEAEIQPLSSPPGIEVEWLLRPPGASSRLARRFADLPPPPADALVWAGAEAGIARPLREIGRAGWNVAPARCQVLNYWRRGRPEGTFSFVS